MATTADVEEKTAKIYDNEGRTVLPKKVRNELDLDVGDTVTYIIVNGSVTVTKKRE